MQLADLLKYISDYEPQYKELILRAYAFAYSVHKGVKRKSGEEYITHPIAVACLLAEMKADADTIAAGLLHDVVEDGENITVGLIEEQFNPTIALLVDGVTKMKKVDFNNDKLKTNEANTRKMIESVTKDIRVLIIKLADRLHNMRTLQYHKPEKQIEISKETMDFFVPFATLIGEYTFKKELEDLSFKYLNPLEYERLDLIIKKSELEYSSAINRTIYEIAQLLNSNGVMYELIPQTKNIYGLHMRLKMYENIEDVHDLFSLKFIVKDINTCYWLRDRINELFESLPDRAKDYIQNPKTNMYRSLHTSIKSDLGRLIQIQIKTQEMYMINAYGLPAYWSLMSLNNPAEKMQNDVSHFQFFSVLQELINSNLPTPEFNREVTNDLLAYKVYVYTPEHEVIELPEGASVIDFAYKIHTDIGDNFISATVNGERVPLDYKLQNGDVINVISEELVYGPRLDLEPYCKTEHAKRKVKELKRKHTIQH